MRQGQDAPGMSPLARRLRERNATGYSYADMSRDLFRRGINLSTSRISAIANDKSADRLTANAVTGLAIVLDMSAEDVIALDDARFGFERKHVARLGDGTAQALEDIDTEVLLNEVARRTRQTQGRQQ